MAWHGTRRETVLVGLFDLSDERRYILRVLAELFEFAAQVVRANGAMQFAI